jgi:hypothetical protein
MVAVLDGKLDFGYFEKMVLNKISEKSRYIAPARGLYLTWVGYERGIK